VSAEENGGPPKKDEPKSAVPDPSVVASDVVISVATDGDRITAVSPPPMPVAKPVRPDAALKKAKTLVGLAPPGAAPIVPRRRTPPEGTPSPIPPAPATAPSLTGATTLIGTPRTPPPPRSTPSAGTAMPEFPKVTPAAGAPAGGALVPPIIRIPQGGLLGSSQAPKTEGTGTLICEILLRNGAVTQENIDRALAIQEERGGQIGRILVLLGACTEEAIARALVEQLRVRKKSGGEDISTAARVNKDVAGLKVLTRPGRTVAVIFLTDLLALLIAAFLAGTIHWVRTYSELGGIDWTTWIVVGPSVALCMLTYLGLELYSPMAKSTPDEIRDIVFSTSLVHLGASLLSTLGNLPIVKWGVMVRGVWWLSTLFLVPVFRSIVRGRLSTQAWWGIPVCVLGAAKTGRLVVRTLKAQPRSGLKPVMLLDDDAAKHGTLRASFTNEVMDVYSVNVSAAHFMSESQRKALSDDIFGGSAAAQQQEEEEDDLRHSAPISSDHIPLVPQPTRSRTDVTAEGDVIGPDSQGPKSQRLTMDAAQFPRGKFAEVDGVPVVGDLSLAPVLAQRLKIPYAVVAMPGVDSVKLLQIVERIGGKFSHLLIIPDLFGFATMGVPAKSLGGVLGVEVRQQLLLPGPRLAKRVMDVALTSVGAFFVFPFLVLIALLIKLDSKGPIFYTQKRLGRDGEHFKAYKFRTMHGDGEARLKAILDADPQLRAEYEIYHKLRKDPRVTRIGRFLRKFSLDEFPQLLNVILGDMSLVGPRPYIERELTEMQGQEKIILRAPPGMTGMWQVSDRNATSFAQRCQIDVYYVRNWSPWLDMHILAKTFGVVIKGSGV
jgi:lipopolysaccharide/colanic/teichoic acid biosynthesis glycosyltransferase